MQDKIDAERRAIEMEKAKAEAAEKARVDTEARVARAEALRPDREKLLSVADEVANIRVPDVSELSNPEESLQARDEVRITLDVTEQAIRFIVEKMA